MTTTPPALIQVLGDASLFRHITGFQLGLDMALLSFWRAHRGENAPLRFDNETNLALVELLVEHGSLRLLRMAERARLSASPQSWFGKPFFDSTVPPPQICKLPIEHVADCALKRNRVEVVEWVLSSTSSRIQDPLRAWGDAIVRAGEDGDLRLLEILHKHAPLSNAFQHLIGRWVSEDMKHADVLRFILDALPAMPATLAMVSVAATHCDWPLLEQLHARGVVALCLQHDQAFEGSWNQGFDSVTRPPSRGLVRFDAVLVARDFDVLEFLLEHFHHYLESYDVVWLVSSPDPEIQRLALRFAGNLQRACVEQINCRRLHCSAVQQCLAVGILSPQWPILIDTIAANGLLDVVQLLHEHGIATATTDAMDQAAENRQWKVVKYLHFNRSEGCTTRAMDAAIEQSDHKNALFLRDHRTEGCSPQAAEKAAANTQSTATLRFLHKHTKISFTPAVMDAAAMYGNLAAVRFLHENRSEGCTFAALHSAMVSGRLDIVRFLFQNYRHLFDHAEFNQDLVTRGVTMALGRRDQRVDVELVFDYFPHLFAPDLLRTLLLKGMFNMYEALRSRFPGDVVSQEIDSALHDAAGSKFELGAIRYIVDVLGRRDLAHRAMDGAASRLLCGTHWVRAVYAVTGPQSCRLSAVRAAIREGVGKHCTSLDRIKFLIRHCCEPNALEEAIEMIPPYADAAIATELRNWDPTTDAEDELQPLHPFLMDPRVSSWAVRQLFYCGFSPKTRTWAAVAACEHDVAMLEIIRDTPAVVDYTHASHGGTLDAEAVAQILRYDDAPTRAIHAGSLEALQWLLTHVDGPVDPTLLGEAVYFDSREIAEWLVVHHPEACVRVQWEPTRSDLFTGYHITEDVSHWLEHTPAVRNALDFGGLARYLVQKDDVESLRRLHTLDPDRVVANTELLTLAKQSPGAKVVGFLSDIMSR